MAKKILVIDDETLNLKMAEHILKSTYDIVCAKTGMAGIEILRQSKVDLVLLDLDMPAMSGLETLTKIRETADISDVKVALLTSLNSKIDAKTAVRLGVLDFVSKPFFPTELLERVRKILPLPEKDSILVVDDDKMNLAVAKDLLEPQYEVSCAISGPEALKYLQSNTPSMLLLDLHMPKMSGLEVLEKLHTMDRVKDIPVIFLTADTKSETEVEIFKAGAMDYIQKPFTAEVVLHRVSRILELYHYQQSLQHEVDKKTAELMESNRKITNLSTQIMMALASAIDAKDTYTNGHSLRVATYSRELARRMSKTPQEINDIYYIGLMHDVGKIGVPGTLITKPDKLTEEEFAIIRTHPIIGAEILENISEMPDISIGAKWHHERYDGQGYPDGLKGEEIPEIARIISVADAYDAMTSRRSYRDMLPQATVKAELENGKGTQFDPQIAAHMIELMEEDTEYQMHE